MGSGVHVFFQRAHRCGKEGFLKAVLFAHEPGLMPQLMYQRLVGKETLFHPRNLKEIPFPNHRFHPCSVSLSSCRGVGDDTIFTPLTSSIDPGNS